MTRLLTIYRIKGTLTHLLTQIIQASVGDGTAAHTINRIKVGSGTADNTIDRIQVGVSAPAHTIL